MSMKKMAAVLLAVVMMLCLLPTAAFAVDEVRVYVGGCGYLNDGTTSCWRRNRDAESGRKNAYD